MILYFRWAFGVSWTPASSGFVKVDRGYDPTAPDLVIISNNSIDYYARGVLYVRAISQYKLTVWTLMIIDNISYSELGRFSYNYGTELNIN